MKRLLLLFVLFSSISLFAQATWDFETAGQDTGWTVFSNGSASSNSDFVKVANPDMAGINTSANVIQFVVRADADPWAGAFNNKITPFTLTADNCIITVMVYKDVISNFNLKLEPPNVDHNVANTVTNQWEKLTFDYTADIGKTVTTITIIPDFPATRTAGSTNYFDNIQFIQTPVPVELASFSALAVGRNIQLNWRTATENNNSGFEVQRSADSKSFNKIGFVSGRGTSTEVSSYSFTDQNVSGKMYYRLKQIDLDGSFTYSKTIEGNSAQPVQFKLDQNYPNPFNPSTTISYAIPTDNFVSIKMYNVLGNEVATLVNEVVTAGQHKINFNASKLSSGVYYYTINSGGFVDTKKLILLK